MNSIKMIHTIARYYNTNERMTNLFIKITNQMITRCKFMILNFRKIRAGEVIKKGQEFPSADILWDFNLFPPQELIPMLKSCVNLNNAYQKQYEQTRLRLQKMPKGKQFEFSTNQIFGKFNLFARRVNKLIDLFGTIDQFRTLEKHNLEGIKPILDSFEKCWKNLQKKNNALLDQSKNTFDRDFVEFNVDVSTVET
jgi:dynein heavy chain